MTPNEDEEEQHGQERTAARQKLKQRLEQRLAQSKAERKRWMQQLEQAENGQTAHSAQEGEVDVGVERKETGAVIERKVERGQKQGSI